MSRIVEIGRKSLLGRDRFAGPFEAVDDAGRRRVQRSGFFDLDARLKGRSAGGEDIVQHRDAHAGFQDALNAFLAAVAFGCLRTKNPSRGRPFLWYAWPETPPLDGADFQPAAAFDVQILVMSIRTVASKLTVSEWKIAFLLLT